MQTALEALRPIIEHACEGFAIFGTFALIATIPSWIVGMAMNRLAELQSKE